MLLWASAAKFLPGISAAGRVSTDGGFRGFKATRIIGHDGGLRGLQPPF